MWPQGPYGGYFQNYQPNYGSGPMFGGVAPPRGPGIFGTRGGTGSGPLEGAIQSFMPMIAEMIRGQMGGYGFNFGSDMNITSAQFAREFVQQMTAARGAGAAADVPQINDLLRGLARIVGHEPTHTNMFGQVRYAQHTEDAIGRLSQFSGTNILPVLAAMFPDAVDQFMPQGSMAVGAASFVNAGRFLTDPVTGNPLSTDKDYGVRILSSLLADRSLKTTAGLGAGRLGQTFEQLAAHGMIGSGTDLRALAAMDLGGVGGLAGGGVDFGSIARNIQSERVKKQIQDYSHVIAAINDVFAEAGQPNAPMGKLISGLQTMTQGGLGMFDPKTLASMVRTMHGAAQLSGMGPEQLAGLAGQLGGQLRTYGGHRGLALPITTYTAAIGQAYANMGFGVPSLEGPDRDQFTQAYGETLVAGMGSAQVNLLSALDVQSRYAPAGSSLALAGEAIRKGEHVVTLADGSQVDLIRAHHNTLRQLFTDSGLSPDALAGQLGVGTQNRAATAMNPAAYRKLTQEAQRNELRRRFYSNPFFRQAVGDGRMDELFDTLVDASRNTDLTESDLAIVVAKRMGLNPEEAARVASIIGPQLTASFGGLTRYGTGVAAFRSINPDFIAEADRNEEKYAARGRHMGMLQHLGRGNFLKHFSRALVGSGFGGPIDPLLFLARVAGMVPQNEVDAELLSSADMMDKMSSNLASGMGFVTGLDFKKNKDMAFSVMDRTSRVDKGWLDSLFDGDAIKSASDKMKASALTMTAAFATLVISGSADGTLSAVLKAAGSVTGGATAIPPASP